MNGVERGSKSKREKNLLSPDEIVCVQKRFRGRAGEAMKAVGTTISSLEKGKQLDLEEASRHFATVFESCQALRALIDRLDVAEESEVLRVFIVEEVTRLRTQIQAILQQKEKILDGEGCTFMKDVLSCHLEMMNIGQALVMRQPASSELTKAMLQDVKDLDKFLYSELYWNDPRSEINQVVEGRRSGRLLAFFDCADVHLLDQDELSYLVNRVMEPLQEQRKKDELQGDRTMEVTWRYYSRVVNMSKDCSHLILYLERLAGAGSSEAADLVRTYKEYTLERGTLSTKRDIEEILTPSTDTHLSGDIYAAAFQTGSDGIRAHFVPVVESTEKQINDLKVYQNLAQEELVREGRRTRRIDFLKAILFHCKKRLEAFGNSNHSIDVRVEGGTTVAGVYKRVCCALMEIVQEDMEDAAVVNLVRSIFEAADSLEEVVFTEKGASLGWTKGYRRHQPILGELAVFNDKNKERARAIRTAMRAQYTGSQDAFTSDERVRWFGEEVAGEF